MSDGNPSNLRWRPASEIGRELAKSPHLDIIRHAAALRWYLQTALFPKGYKAAREWLQAVTLSSSGKEATALWGFPDSTEDEQAETAMTSFCLLFHHELLVDCEKSDLKKITSILNRELLSGQLRWPHRFGRTLYDKFNDNYKGDRTDHLLPDEAWDFVDGTPQGVYQVGGLISGPLGMLEVGHHRYIPPNRNLLLWHCSDPGCLAAHGVDLLPIEVPVVKMFRDGRKTLNCELGPASEWQTALADVLGRDIPRRPYTYSDVCSVIADCIVGVERTKLVASALSRGSGHLFRDFLSQPPRKKTAGQGSPEALAKVLTAEEQLQLLFTLQNSDLVNLVDSSVSAGSIRVPLAEIRSSRNSPTTTNRIPISELSPLGIRCTGNEPLLDFWALLWGAYSSSNRVSELDWLLRNRTGSPTQNFLLSYLCQNEPSVVIKDLVLASEPITKAICDKVFCAMDDLTENGFNNRLLWKIGFDLPRFKDTLLVLRRRLELFNQELLAVGVLHDEHERERIRSAGVNLFVSIEEFLDLVVSYNVWLLASDHFIGTRFRYDVHAARQIVPQVLGASIGSGDIAVRWSVDKANTLGTLMAYLSAAANWMETLPGCRREALARHEDDLPHFADYELRIFPFRHSALWADCDFSSLKRMVEGFASIAAKAARSNLTAIRNGLDHHRDEASFPKIDQMLAFVAHFREAVDNADENRYFPKEFWLAETNWDRFRRQEFVFRDYRGRRLAFFGPSFVHGLPRVKLNAPAIIAPGSLLGFANTEIVIELREKSVHSEYWSGYPRRRQIPNPNPGIAELQVPSGQTQPSADATNRQDGLSTA